MTSAQNLVDTNAVSMGSVHTMLKILSNLHRGLKICHFNARSFNTLKLDFVRNILNGVDVDIICVSETWFKPDISNYIYGIPNYTLYRNDRLTDTRGGGVAIYCRTTLNCRIIDKSVNSDVEYLILEVCDGGAKCIISCVYNPNKIFSPVPFFDAFAQFAPVYEHIIVCGDFNANLLKADSISCQLLNAVSATGLAVMNSTYPTRYSPNDTPSLLDLLIVANPPKVLLLDQLPLDGISDHDLIFATYDIDFTHSTIPLTFQFRDYKAININSLGFHASCMPWDDCKYVPNVDEKLGCIQSRISELCESQVPLKKIHIRNKKCP